jgi:hypothetical protein
MIKVKKSMKVSPKPEVNRNRKANNLLMENKVVVDK